MANRIQLRRDTSTNWAAVNPILTQGEVGLELNTGKIKIGNGIAAWNSLSYFTLNYSDLTGAPANLSDLTNDAGFITAADLPANELPVNAAGYLRNDGTGVLTWEEVSGFSGNYNDLTNKPTIPEISKTQTAGSAVQTSSLNVTPNEISLTATLDTGFGPNENTIGKVSATAGQVNISSLDQDAPDVEYKSEIDVIYSSGVTIRNSPGPGAVQSWVFGNDGKLTLPNGAELWEDALIGAANQDLFLGTKYNPQVSANCAIAAGDEFVADIEFNDDITVVQVGWTVNVGGTDYTVTAIDPAPPANQYRITAAGAPFVQSEVYTFTNPVPVDKGWNIRQGTGTLVSSVGGAILSSESIDNGGGLTYRDFAVELPTPDGLNEQRWTFRNDGKLELPLGGDIVDSNNVSKFKDYNNFDSDIIPDADATRSLGSPTRQWKEIFVSTGSIYIGNVKLSNQNGTLQINTVEKQIDPETEEEIEVVLETESVQLTRTSHLELTNIPFVTQPVSLGAPVTFTVLPQGSGATFDVAIDALGAITSVTVNAPGTGYVVDQIYAIPYFVIGGIDPQSDVLITVDTVGASGDILTLKNVAFRGLGAGLENTYTNLSADYQPSFFDNIDVGLILTRDNQQALFNSAVELEYDNNTYASPLGTAWNSDGWGDLTNLRSRSYTNLRAANNNAIGNNIVGNELVMYDTANDKYYTFSFTDWGQNNGAYSYTRRLITDPNFFKKVDNGNEIDIIIPDDGLGAGVGITRDTNNGIYNPYREGSWDSDVSPGGTLWNIDGYDDLSNIESRTYLPFYAAYGFGGLGYKVPGSKSVMYVPDNGKYYAVEWLSWTQAGGGGFSYIRRELDLTKINEGLKFADGTILKSAEGVGRVKSTASGERRIEEVSGSKTISVTGINITNLTTTASRAGTNTQEIWIDSTTTTIDDIIGNPAGNGNAYSFEFSLDNVNWWLWNGGTGFIGDERGYSIPASVTYNQGDTVYFRYKTGGAPVVWWDKADLPGGSANFRGAVIDYHAYTGEATWIGTIHIVSDSGEDHISHTEVGSGTTDSENDDLWLVQNEGTISYRRIDGESKTAKFHWTAKVFYGSEFYD